MINAESLEKAMTLQALKTYLNKVMNLFISIVVFTRFLRIFKCVGERLLCDLVNDYWFLCCWRLMYVFIFLIKLR